LQVFRHKSFFWTASVRGGCLPEVYFQEMFIAGSNKILKEYQINYFSRQMQVCSGESKENARFTS
jgi:hypothetical protein